MSHLLKTAIIARSKFQDNVIKSSLLSELYKKYNPRVEDIDEFVGLASKSFPDLNCGLASVYLQHTLQEGKIVQGSYNNHNHTFLKVRSEIVDITADQFGGPKVYVGALVLPWSLTPGRS
jgi:hypothetical protein